MRSFRFQAQLLVVFLFILSTCVSVAFGQAAPDWETLRPDGEEFSVQMPKGSVAESSKEPYHKMEINTRTYISTLPSGAVFAVVSLSGIKSNPALYTEMQRVNSYVDAFKTLFAPKVRKDLVAKLTLVGDKNLQGHNGREYRMSLGNLNGTAQVFATRKRFYSIVYLNTKKDEALQEQFLGSFVLPDKIDAPPRTASDLPTGGQPVAPNATVAEAAPAKPASNDNPDKKDDDPKSTEAGPGSNPGSNPKTITGGMLNSKAISLPAPDYPAIARQAKASGTVVVQVTVDESGGVISAHAVSGHPLLQASAVAAARQARFSPTLLMGEPVKVTGIITYNFGEPMN